MSLLSLGWDDFFANHFQSLATPDLVPARVVLEHKHACIVRAEAGELTASCTGHLLHTAAARSDLPAVGDWVAVRIRPGETHADIHAVLPRRTKFSRAAAGAGGGEQIVATNVDTVLLVTALDQNYNLRRIERYLALSWESGAQPIVVLSKADLHPDPAAAQAEVASLAMGAPVVALSAARGDGLTDLAPWLIAGRTLALLGSSGVGKSTLINRIIGHDHLATSEISMAVGKGRHTTTRRELLTTPSGALVIDTPGMRELQFWDLDASSLDATFADITTLARRCKFADCGHRAEPGCAVQTALENGSLDFSRWQSFQKLQREQAHAARKADPRLARELKAGWKKINRQMRATQRFNPDE